MKLNRKDNARSVRLLVIIFTLLFIYYEFKSTCRKSVHELPEHLQKYLLNENVIVNNTIDAEKMKRLIEYINSKQNIRNLVKFKPVEDHTPVLVIQVHKNIKHLQYLIISLSQVQGIQTALLIFSHSFYHESINRLVRKIDFCKVMQIFYPFSLQLHPNKHPGIDPGDCEPGLSKTKNKKYCLIRDARLTEHKQHWWWKLNFIFQGTKRLHKHRTPVVFLEEDNYVAPDFLHMFHYITRSLEYFPFVEVMSFGRPWTKNVDMDLLTVESWRPPFDIGFAFNETTWKKILQLSGQFCMYNDYSWSYSLLHVFENFPKGHVDMVACMAPRVISTKEYNSTVDIFKKNTELFSALDLFPKKVQAVLLFGPAGRVERVLKGPPVGRGGWNDLRDQLLCLDPLMSTTTEEKRYNEYDVTKF